MLCAVWAPVGDDTQFISLFGAAMAKVVTEHKPLVNTSTVGDITAALPSDATAAGFKGIVMQCELEQGNCVRSLLQRSMAS